MRSTLTKATTVFGAILAGVTLGYFLRSSPPGDAPPGGRQTTSAPAAPRHELRPLARAAFAGELSAQSQDRLRELETLAASDPGKAMTRLPAFRDTELLPLALTAIARGWARKDPQAAAQWAAQLESPDDQVSAALGLVPVWAASDPEACLAWTQARPAGNMREISLVELADTWATRQPADALSRFLTMKSEAGTERGLHAITSQWVLDDPDTAIPHISALPSNQRRDEFLETALVSLTNQDPDRVWSETMRFDDPERVEHVRAMALEAMAETRPAQALKLAASGGNSPTLLGAVARGWASWDAPAARTWINTLEDSELAGAIRREISD